MNEEDDPDLAAAIAASLRDLEQSQDTGFYSHQFSRQTINPDDLSPLEMENIELFSVLMERIHASGRQVSSDEQVNHLYTQIGALQPKLLKSLDSTITKYSKFSGKIDEGLDESFILLLKQESWWKPMKS